MNNSTAMTASTANDSVVQNVLLRYDFSKLIEVFAPAAFTAERVVPPIWYLLGLFGNPASAVIWYGRRMRRNNSSAVYLGSLAVSDFIFLCLHLLFNLHSSHGHDVYNTFAGCEAFMFFYYVPQYLSVVLVAAFTVERYVAVCHPFLKEKWCTVRRAFALVAACLAFSVAVSSAQIYVWTFDPTYSVCAHRHQAMSGGDASFVNVWTWATEMLVFAALPLLVLAFNVLVLREIIKLSRNGVISRQQSRGGGGGSSSTASTITLLSVSFFLIVTQLPATVVLNIQPLFHIGPVDMTDDEVRADPTWSSLFSYLVARKVIEVLCLSHNACYFLVYCLTGKHFRREVVFLVSLQGRLRCWQRLAAAKTHKGERYSMVSSNGHTLATTDCSVTTAAATAYTTAM